MVNRLTFSTSIFESLGVLSSFNFAEMIWEKYEKFAVPKMIDSTMKLRGAAYYLKYLTPKEAGKEVNSISPLIPVLSKLKNEIEQIDDKEFHHFKIAALDFFEAVDFLYFNLQDIANVHSSYELSKPILAADWDSKEDEHWDNY